MRYYQRQYRIDKQSLASFGIELHDKICRDSVYLRLLYHQDINNFIFKHQIAMKST